ncbi:hypothetical protein M885DRAFT_530929 [Pelagophyceae sp. CCMP2097]|nr:hypothetical protein M885DRAFT_530929 [Pelagophyceae sp. CCMP2097]
MNQITANLWAAANASGAAVGADVTQLSHRNAAVTVAVGSASVTVVHNVAELQAAGAERRLFDFVRAGRFDAAFFSKPHPDCYFAYRAAVARGDGPGGSRPTSFGPDRFVPVMDLMAPLGGCGEPNCASALYDHQCNPGVPTLVLRRLIELAHLHVPRRTDNPM